MTAGKDRENQQVEQTKKMVPLITCETNFGQHVRELVFGVNIYLIWILRSKLSLSNNQSRATLWVLGQVSHRWTSALMVILITASLFSKMYN